MNGLKVGDRVNYHSIIGGPVTSTGHEIKHIGDIPSQKNVAWITGKSGCVCMSALSIDTETKE